MRPYHIWHHPPEGFGVWHHSWPELFWLMPLMFALPLLVLLTVWLWSARHTIFDWLGSWLPDMSERPEPASAVETLRQRYARGEIDDDTYVAMLGRLNDSECEYGSMAGDIYGTAGEEDANPRFRPRADIPIDWS